MTEFDKAITALVTMATAATEGFCYSTWSDEFTRTNAAKYVDRFLERNGRIVVTDFTSAECDALVFGKWDEKSGLRLIPLYLYPFLAPGQTFASISGKSITIDENYTDPKNSNYMDDDHRAGSLAFGFVSKS